MPFITIKVDGIHENHILPLTILISAERLIFVRATGNFEDTTFPQLNIQVSKMSYQHRSQNQKFFRV